MLATGPKPGAFYDYEPAPPDDPRPRRADRGGLPPPPRPAGAAAAAVSAAPPAVVSVIPGGQSAGEVRGEPRGARDPVPPALWAELKAEGLVREDARPRNPLITLSEYREDSGRSRTWTWPKRMSGGRPGRCYRDLRPRGDPEALHPSGCQAVSAAGRSSSPTPERTGGRPANDRRELIPRHPASRSPASRPRGIPDGPAEPGRGLARSDVPFLIDDDFLTHPGCAAEIMAIHEADTPAISSASRPTWPTTCRPASRSRVSASRWALASARWRRAVSSADGSGLAPAPHFLIEASELSAPTTGRRKSVPCRGARRGAERTHLFHGCRMLFRREAVGREPFEPVLRSLLLPRRRSGRELSHIAAWVAGHRAPGPAAPLPERHRPGQPLSGRAAVRAEPGRLDPPGIRPTRSRGRPSS